MSEGISETLIHNFTKIPALRVTARSTAFRYKDKEIEPQKVGKEPGVGAILMGKVLQRGDNLSVQVDLINVADGTQIWGNQYYPTAHHWYSILLKRQGRFDDSLRKIKRAQELDLSPAS